MTLGKQLEKYRLACGLSYPELAERSGVAVGTINALEKRGSKRSQYWAPLASAIGLTFEQLADEEQDFSDEVRRHVKLYQVGGNVVPHIASEKDPGEWGGSWWPFSVSREQMRAALLPEDIARIDAYVVGIVQLREAEQKNCA
ncbi:MAG: helix-turn-helix transcriptional regulator [Hydrogenophaga sp.]|jgi:DNA-binding XRE family transcriptional regulator|nr:helix-turn-helix transcriptional regulator [Hydrogenophaga sp.]